MDQHLTANADASYDTGIAQLEQEVAAHDADWVGAISKMVNLGSKTQKVREPMKLPDEQRAVVKAFIPNPPRPQTARDDLGRTIAGCRTALR